MAGEASRKLKQSAKEVTFDFNGPEFYISKVDKSEWTLPPHPDAPSRFGLGENQVVPHAVRLLLINLQRAAFGRDGMDRKDGKIWAAWLERMDDDTENQVKVTWGEVQWLYELATKDTLKMPGGLAQWREAFISYVEKLKESIPNIQEVS